MLCAVLLGAASMPAFAAAQPQSILSQARWTQMKPAGLLTAVFDGERWGYIDSTTGAVIIDAQFYFAGVFHEGLALTVSVSAGKKYYRYIDATGKTIIDLTEKYHNIDSAGDFGSGRAAVYLSDSKHTLYIDKLGRQTMSCPYYARGFHDGLAVVPAAGGYGYMDTTGAMVIPASFDEAWNFCGGRALVRKNGRFGFINKTGSYVLTPQFEDVCLADAQYAQQAFCQGLAVVKKNGKWGAVSASGTFVVAPVWDMLRPFDGGYARAMKDGKWGLIDAAGRVAAAPVHEAVTGVVSGQAFFRDNGAYTLRSLSAQAPVEADTQGWTNVTCANGAFIFEKDGLFGLMLPGDAPSAWAQAETALAEQAGLVPEDMQRGYADNCTRADFCRLAVRLVEVHTKKSAQQFIKNADLAPAGAFSDTADSEILTAAAMGIVNGRPDGTFGPDEPVSREQAAAMLTRAAQLLSGLKASQPVAFADAGDTAAWARGSVDFVSANAIMRGDAAGRFLPKALYTREQAFLTVYRLYKIL